MTLPVVPTGEDELRALFNDRRFHERAQTGELSRAVADDWPAPKMGPGAKTEMVEYFDGDVKVAVAHQYVDKFGNILASRKPDPKWVLVEGVIYQKQRKKR